MEIINDTIIRCNTLKHIATEILDLVSHTSCEAEISIIQTTGININTRYGNLENIEFNNDCILEITIFHKNRKGHVTSRNLNKQNISNIIHTAINISKQTSPDLCFGLANKSLLAYQYLDLDLFHPTQLNTKFIIDLTSKTEKIALEYDKRIIYTEGACFNSHTTTRIIGNTHGMLQSYNSTQYSLSCCVIASNNNKMERNYAYTVNRSFQKLHSPEWVGKECAYRTLQRLNSKKLITMETPVLFAAEISNSLFKHLVTAITGINVYRKSTFLLNQLGNIILPNWLSIIEHPHIPAELASAPFDHEGVKSINRIIVKNGMLCTWLLNNYSARKLKLETTGHADGIYNWYINHTNLNFLELIKKMNTGLIITELMGQGVNIMTGDYSRGGAGFWVQNGDIQYPVHEITISGNLKHMFKNITDIGNDIEKRSNIKCGSVLISSMMVAGK